jgi:hypothetical protein
MATASHIGVPSSPQSRAPSIVDPGEMAFDAVALDANATHLSSRAISIEDPGDMDLDHNDTQGAKGVHEQSRASSIVDPGGMDLANDGGWGLTTIRGASQVSSIMDPGGMSLGDGVGWGAETIHEPIQADAVVDLGDMDLSTSQADAVTDLGDMDLSTSQADAVMDLGDMDLSTIQADAVMDLDDMDLPSEVAFDVKTSREDALAQVHEVKAHLNTIRTTAKDGYDINPALLHTIEELSDTIENAIEAASPIGFAIERVMFNPELFEDNCKGWKALWEPVGKARPPVLPDGWREHEGE